MRAPAPVGGVVIAGVSTRAFAESAVRAGYSCVSVDAFGDLDQRTLVRNRALTRDLGRRYSAAAAAVLARGFDVDAAAYVGNFENHPAAVRHLAAGRLLLGNEPAVLMRARNPRSVAGIVRSAGGRFPVMLGPDTISAAACGRSWLRKPLRGGGGSGVVRGRPGIPLQSYQMLQERVDGILASAAFAADGARAVVLGLSRQLAGDAAFGAREFRYCGSLFPLVIPDVNTGHLFGRIEELARAVTAAFGLRGVNGIDFVVRDGEPYVLEVNPRPTASMELIERALGFSIFDTHVRACRGELPEVDSERAPVGSFGKAILFAREDVVMGDTRPWLDRDDIRDIPFPGDCIGRGRPICTVFARGTDSDTCYREMVRTAMEMEEEIDDRENATVESA